MKRFWVFLLALLILIAVVTGVTRAKKRVSIEITVAKATAGAFVREVSGTGNVEARVNSLTFNRTGRIAHVLVHEGDHVRAGAVLAELTTGPEIEDLAATREKLRALKISRDAQQAEAEANLQQLDIQLAETANKLALTRRLFAAGAAASDEVETQEHQLLTQRSTRTAQAARATSNHRDLNAQLATLQATIQSSERTLHESRLIAPVSGAISQLDLRPGEAAQGTVKLVEDRSLRVKIRMAEADTIDVTVGQSARVELDATPDQPLTARVEKLGIAADIQGQGASSILPVTLQFNDPRATAMARPGFTATGRITTLRLPRAIQVPVEALVELNEEGQKHAYLWVVETKTQCVARKEVHVIARNLTSAAVRGIDADSTVVTLPPDTLKAGSAVHIKPDDNKGTK